MLSSLADISATSGLVLSKRIRPACNTVPGRMHVQVHPDSLEFCLAREARRSSRRRAAEGHLDEAEGVGHGAARHELRDQDVRLLLRARPQELQATTNRA